MLKTLRSTKLIDAPVEAATAAINTDGSPAMMTPPATTRQMILAVDVELEERGL